MTEQSLSNAAHDAAFPRYAHRLCTNYAQWPRVRPLRAAISSNSSAVDGAYVSLGMGETNRWPWPYKYTGVHRGTRRNGRNGRDGRKLSPYRTHRATARRLVAGENVTKRSGAAVRVERVTTLSLEGLWRMAGLHAGSRASWRSHGHAAGAAGADEVASTSSVAGDTALPT